MHDDVDGRIADILSTVLGRTVLASENVERDEDSLWDSLKHIEIIFLIEDVFHLQLSENDIESIKCSHDIRNIVAGRNGP